ncbi:MAG TPA: AMP-binding protein [Thermoanaerobaculia bacterium]
MIFRAPEEPLAIPRVGLTQFLLETAGARGDKPALIDAPSGRTLTYRGWADGVRATAAGLAQRGFRKGDVFAIYSPNHPEYAIAFHAVSLLGGVVTTINPAYTPAELGHQLKDAGARYLVTTPAFVDKATVAAQENHLREVFVFGESFDSLLATRGDPPDVAIDAVNDVVALPSSSGTTGLPKGVMLTHHNLVANILQSARVFGVGGDDTTLGVLPFFHIYGLVVIMNLSLHIGATVVTMPRFDLEQCLATLQKYRVSYAYVVPPIILALAKSPIVDKYDLSSVKRLFSGAAPLPPEVARAAASRLHCGMTQGYGMTETSPVTHVTREIDAPGIGPAVPNTEAKIAAIETGAELGPDEEGEICVRGPQVMKGYLNNPTATAAMIDNEGWLHTGDVGYADAGGTFYVVDRVKELIKYKGMQIAPAELEAILLSHPAVADAAVVPLADEEAGQVPKAFVVLKEQSTPEDLMTYVENRVARYKRVRYVEIIDQIPKSPSGKILRRVLVARANQ